MTTRPLDYSIWAAARLREGIPIESIEPARMAGVWLEWLGICRSLNGGGDRREAFDHWIRAHPQGRDLMLHVADVPPGLAEFPEPEAPAPSGDLIYVDVPELPKPARLTSKQARAAEGTGEFVSVFADYIHKVVNTLPREMAEAAALTTASIAVSRRLCLPAPFEDIYPILWVLWVAPSTIYHKTTALNLIRKFIREINMSYLLLPQESSNDRLMQNMAGIKPVNFDQMKLWEQARERHSWQHAAQRGIVVDEASSVFGSFDKEYNRGKIETFLTAYDCEEEKAVETNKHGLIYIRYMYMPILGATTPMSIQFANSLYMWGSGFWPRFTMLAPERLFPPKPLKQNFTRIERPVAIADAIVRLLNALPEPPALDPSAEPAPPPSVTVLLGDGVWEHWQHYNEAMSYQFQNPDVISDYRLRLICGRLPVKLLRVAILLAALDWDGEGAPRIEMCHYARAHQIAEQWRVNAHRFVEIMNRKPEGEDLEKRVLNTIRNLKSGGRAATTREIWRTTHWPREVLDQMLEQMRADGLIESAKTVGGRTSEWVVNG